MFELVIIGLVSALSLFVLLLIAGKKTLRRVLGFGVIVDIVLSALLIWMFAGTYSGMVAALAGGLFISAVLRLTAKIVGREHLTWNSTVARLEWTPA